jgi:dynactin complex subunit
MRVQEKGKGGREEAAMDFQQEFLKERERLAKLWEAYAQMEKENIALKARVSELMKEQAGPSGDVVKDLMKENDALKNQVKILKGVVEEMDKDIKALRGQGNDELIAR